jgi:hypothetical protein
MDLVLVLASSAFVELITSFGGVLLAMKFLSIVTLISILNYALFSEGQNFIDAKLKVGHLSLPPHSFQQTVAGFTLFLLVISINLILVNVLWYLSTKSNG